jgi:transcriptional regulator with XRE-family HTH domain
MTLDQLLKSYGIHRPADLKALLGIERQYAWQLWHGTRKFTPEQALKLLDARGVPMDKLYRADVAPSSVPKGRPRKGKEDASEEGPAHE